MKRQTLNALLQIAAGIALVIAGVYLVTHWISRERAAGFPSGHTVLRPPDDVSALALIDGSVWAGGKQGLFIFAADGTPLPVPEALRPLRFVSALLREADGRLWIAHEEGMTLWQNTAARNYSSLAGAFPGRGLAVLRDRDGTLWAGSDRQLARLEGDVFRVVPLPESIALTEAAVLYQDRDGVLWIGDSSPRSPGLVRRDARGFHLYTRLNGLTHHAINKIMQRSSSSDLWVGTGFADEGGAVVINNEKWRSIGTQHGLAGKKVRSIFEDSNGRMWFGSEYNGIAVFGDSRLAVIGESDGLAGPEVKAILEYPAGTFWLGTNGGLTRIARFNATQGDSRFPGFGGLQQ